MLSRFAGGVTGAAAGSTFDIDADAVGCVLAAAVDSAEVELVDAAGADDVEDEEEDEEEDEGEAVPADAGATEASSCSHAVFLRCAVSSAAEMTSLSRKEVNMKSSDERCSDHKNSSSLSSRLAVFSSLLSLAFFFSSMSRSR